MADAEQLRIYGIYVVSKDGLEIENVCPKQMDASAMPHLSTFLPLLQNILRRDIGEKFTIELSNDLLYCFLGEHINIIVHTERKTSEEFLSVCEKISNDIINEFPILKNWDRRKIPELKNYLNRVFFHQKFKTFVPINKTNISLEEEIIREPCDSIDAIERAHQLFLMVEQFYEDKRFLNKCTYRMEKQHNDCYHVPRVYSLLGIVFNNLGEYGMSYEYFERAIDIAFKNKQEAMVWGDDEELKTEKNARIKNSSIALADAYYGLSEYNLAKNDFLKAKSSLKMAKEEFKFIDEIAKNLREFDFELMYINILLQQKELLEKELAETTEEEKKVSKSIKIENIENELEENFYNLQTNIENKIKNTYDEVLKRFYKEKLVKLYYYWGDWLSAKENFFSKKFNDVAIEKYEKSLEIMDEIGLIRNRGKILHNLVLCAAIVGNFEKGDYYLQYLKKESEFDKTIILETKVSEIFYNIFYYMRENNAQKILEMVLEINNISQKEKKIEKRISEKLLALNKKVIEFLKNK